MSNRERWIVYPLLFFAVGLGLKNQVVVPNQAEFLTVRCQELVVESETGAARVVIRESHPGIPTITMSALIDAGETSKETEVAGTSADDDGAGAQADPLLAVPHRVAELSANASGGVLRLFGPAAMPALWMGHDGTERWSGVTGEGLPVTEQSEAAGTRIPWAPLAGSTPPTTATEAASDTTNDANNDEDRVEGTVEGTKNGEDSAAEKAVESE